MVKFPSPHLWKAHNRASVAYQRRIPVATVLPCVRHTLLSLAQILYLLGHIDSVFQVGPAAAFSAALDAASKPYQPRVPRRRSR